MTHGKLNVLVTAGGTTEMIDGVRSITNTGTGRLGALTAEAFAASELVGRIFYVCSERAVRPAGEKITVIVADDTSALEKVIGRLCSSEPINAVIHSMAVSDYRTRTVTTSSELAKRLAKNALAEENELADIILNAPSLAGGGKISSDFEDLIVVMEKTPKVISMFRGLLPKAILVGFKLLNGAAEDALIETARVLLVKNDCDYVLANDLELVREDSHLGHLIDRDGAKVTYYSKVQIADGIASAVLSHFEQTAQFPASLSGGLPPNPGSGGV